MAEHASQNEIFWKGQVLYKSTHEHIIESDDLELNGYEVGNAYQVFCPTSTPQLEYYSDDRENLRVIDQRLVFTKEYAIAKYPDGKRESSKDNLINSSYIFDNTQFLVGVSTSNADWRNGEKSLEINLHTERGKYLASFEYNPETGELETVELPIKTGDPDDNHPIFYPRIKYSLKIGGYLGREDKPLKTQTEKPKIINYRRGYSLIKFNLKGLQQTIITPDTLKVNDKNPFDQFANLDSNDWVDSKLLEVLQIFSSTN
jgi:hypothetical protein